MTLPAIILASALFPAEINGLGLAQGDDARLEPEGDHQALFVYGNDGAQMSVSGQWTLQLGDIIVDFWVEAGTGPERVTILPRAGYVAIPDEIAIPDGLEGEALITPPMF